MLTEVPEWGDQLTRVSVWVALLGYLAGPIAGLIGRKHDRWQLVARAIYTMGLGAFLIHVGAAFHFFYGWSHTIALAETANETAAVTGVASGAGLYLNYAFTLLWLVDGIWWWCAGIDGFRRRHPGIGTGMHAFFVFMAFNATVVFESGWSRWLGAGATLGLAVLVGVRLKRASTS